MTSETYHYYIYNTFPTVLAVIATNLVERFKPHDPVYQLAAEKSDVEGGSQGADSIKIEL